MRGNREGFTLLEMVIAVALVCVMAVVLAGAFDAGLRIWERARRFGGRESEMVIALQTMQKDLRNATPCRLAPFRGDGAWVEIPSVVRFSEPPAAGECMGVIRYERGANGATLDRVTTVFRPLEAVTETRETMVSSVDKLAISFGDKGEGDRTPIVWNTRWDNPSNFPAAVSIVMGVRENGEHVEQRRVVVLSRR